MLLVGAGVVAAAAVQPAAAAGWSLQPAPTPAHSADTDLLGVSCRSERDCFAVGQSYAAWTGELSPLIEHWNGSTWSIQRTPTPMVDGWEGTLSAVSCGASGACMAVGSFDTDATEGPLAERWDGSSWLIQRTVNPSYAYQFDGVSCVSRTACIAVGSGGQSFAEGWDGKRWSVENLHFGDPQGRANGLADVSCLSESLCAAVGADDVGLCGDDYSDYDVPVLGFWTSGRWTLRRHPNVACSGSYVGANDLNAVSCTSPAACTAVGSEVDRWDGRRWSIQSAPIGSGDLLGVSCTSDTTCTAVGSRIDTWNGRGWSSVPIAAPARVSRVALGGIACVSPRSCVAVGASETSAGRDSVLVEVETAGAR